MTRFPSPIPCGGHVTCFLRQTASLVGQASRLGGKSTWGRGRWGALSSSQRQGEPSTSGPSGHKGSRPTQSGCPTRPRPTLDFERFRPYGFKVPPNKDPASQLDTSRSLVTLRPDFAQAFGAGRSAPAPECTAPGPAYLAGAWTRTFVRYRSPVPASVFAPC